MLLGRVEGIAASYLAMESRRKDRALERKKLRIKQCLNSVIALTIGGLFGCIYLYDSYFQSSNYMLVGSFSLTIVVMSLVLAGLMFGISKRYDKRIHHTISKEIKISPQDIEKLMALEGFSEYENLLILNALKSRDFTHNTMREVWRSLAQRYQYLSEIYDRLESNPLGTPNKKVLSLKEEKERKMLARFYSHLKKQYNLQQKVG